jgi:hypothetical protein
MPSATPQELAAAIIDCIDAGERVINLSLTLTFRQDTLVPCGFLPNFGGHHDCVVIPAEASQLRSGRCTTL